MANRMLNLVETTNHGVVEILGSFAPNGASAPLPNPLWSGSGAAGQWGQGVASITRTAAGVFLVTLSDSWYRLLAQNIEIRPADGAVVANVNAAGIQNTNVTGAVVNGNPARSFNVSVSSIGTTPTLADIAAATGALVYFTLWVSKSSVQ